MAKVSASGAVPSPPEKTWATAADLNRFNEWLILHEAWRGPVPTEFSEGTTLTSVVTVKGFRNRISWRVVTYDEPHRLAIRGDGVGGIKVNLVLSVEPDVRGSVIAIEAEVTGKPVFGPIGMTIGRALKGELQKSVANLGGLLA